MHNDPVTWTQQTSTGLYPALQPALEHDQPVESEKPEVCNVVHAHTHEAGPSSPIENEGVKAEEEVLVARRASWMRDHPTAKADPNYHITLFHSSIGVDTVEKYTTYVVMVIEFFKLIMASLLAVFVPQLCSARSSAASDARKAAGDGECTFVELFLSAEPYNIFVLAWNFLTLVVCLVHRSLTSQRESFMVDHFDVNKSLPPDNIKEVLRTNPTVAGILTDWNKRIFTSAFLFMTANVLNFIFSAVLIWSRVANYRTTTVFLTNVSLLAQLIFWDLSVARASWKGESGEQEALSLVNKDNRRYNDLDHRRTTDTGVCEVTGHHTM
jgi:hypothetical protein